VSDISRVFEKVFVREFYRLNAGFFIVIITLTFGFMSGVEHKALAEFFIASPWLTLIPISVWLVYSLKVISFNKQRTAFPANGFLFHHSLLSFPKQFVSAMQTLALQCMPVILYGGFLIAMALKNNLMLPVMMILCAIIILITVCSLALLKFINGHSQEIKTSSLKKIFDRYTVRPLWLMYISALFRQEPFLFIGTKIFTGLLLFAVLQLYAHDTFDHRLLAMAASVAGIGNFMVMTQLMEFDLRNFQLMKNVPLTLTQRWLTVALITLILLIPEGAVVAKYFPELSVQDFVSIVFIMPAIALLIYSLQFVKYKSQESFSRLTFGITMLHIVLILFKIPVVIFIVVNLTLSWIVFRKRYYTYETMPVIEK
jgi:hypothetical protein